ncbi:MAG: choice-of-anchor D domain-containing protein [Myxococcales bacterium]|nr:choice-of-anchor D domain-containing protein [Myxococcales bacterium]
MKPSPTLLPLALLSLLLALPACDGAVPPPIGDSCVTDDECPAGEACTGGTCSSPVDAGTPFGAGEIQVAPATLDFGSAPLGSQVSHELIITNVGVGPLTISRLEVLEADALAEYVASPSGLVTLELAPSESTRVTVTLTQADDEIDRGELRISSNDDDEPIVPITLLSELKGTPRVTTTPDELDFGVVAWGDTPARDVDLTNTGTGNTPLTISFLDITDDTGLADAYALELFHVDPVTAAETPAALPAHLSPGGATLRARVVLLSADLGAGTLPAESLRIVSNDADPRDAELFLPILGSIIGCAAPAPELCNGLDDDCDGTVDDGSPGGGAPCVATDPGSCQSGTIRCTDGALACVSTTTPVVESCNGADDDCDGESDEGLLRPCTSGCGVGVEFCVVGTWIGCNAPPPSPEICDGVDNDCDGFPDDGNPGGGVPCLTVGLGACAPGTLTCAGGSLTCIALHAPSAELCNGLDDDCDGIPDDGDPGSGMACATGEPGICATGTTHCDRGFPVCRRSIDPSLELCNGVDDDCNGGTLDGSGDPTVGAPCDGPDADLCAEGTRICVLGALSCNDTTLSTLDLCNGIDDDCSAGTPDGAADARIGGSCDGADGDLCDEGMNLCLGGTVFCSDASATSAESCNGDDDDCNAVTDDGGSALCPPGPHVAATACGGAPGCGIAACDAGWANCNFVNSDGCEADLGSSPTSCGTCGLVCGGGLACIGGVCGSVLVTFTTCAATGATGPSQAACDGAYAGGSLAGRVTVAAGRQEWVVPASGNYRIEAIGAQGSAGQPGYAGGRAAQMRGVVALTMGTRLRILVGQSGLGAGSNSNGGGGGGSFVVTTDGTTLIVAGGGGGTRAGATRNGFDASLTTTGQNGMVSGDGAGGSVCAGGAGGAGGAFCSSWGAGGGGMTGDGQRDSSWGFGGTSFAGGGAGGTAGSVCGDSAHGGFGSGGCGSGCHGGGGGGGYSGGGGGWIAGGGGSFNSGSLQVNTITTRSGAGQVTIERVP